MVSRQVRQQEDTNFRVLRLLQDDPHMTQRDLASALGVSLGGINYCLRALLEKGLVKIQRFRHSDQKWAYAYFLTPRGIAEKAGLTGQFLRRKMKEYAELRAEINSLKRAFEHEGVGATPSRNER